MRRFDFGRSCRPRACANCHRPVLNRGCSTCEARLCRPCFHGHWCRSLSVVQYVSPETLCGWNKVRCDVIVTGLDGETVYEATIGHDYTALSLKNAIEEISRVPVQSQQICRSGEILHDDDLVLSVPVPHAPLELKMLIRQWALEEIAQVSQELTSAVIHRNLHGVNAILQKLPFCEVQTSALLGRVLNDLRELRFHCDVLDAETGPPIMDAISRLSLELQSVLVLGAVEINGLLLWLASAAISNNEMIVAAAVRRNGLALQYAHKEMQSNQQIVMVAVQQNGCALEFASEDMQDNQQTVLTAVQQDCHAISYASKRMQNDRLVLLTAQENMSRRAAEAARYRSPTVEEVD